MQRLMLHAHLLGEQGREVGLVSVRVLNRLLGTMAWKVAVVNG